jgi:DNA mismatch repair protein MutS2
VPIEGDEVRVIGQTTVGILEQVKGKNAFVSFDSIQVSINLDKLEKVKVKIKKPGNRSASKHNSILREIHQRSMDFKPNIDIRGQRAEEALSYVKQWVDEAILIGQKDLEILHGTGSGILRQIIRDYLSGMREVESAKDAHVDAGGSGKTIIKLN